MEANTRHLERIFDQTITYQIPLFQRPYVWTKARNWEPLWEDIQSLLDRHLRGAKIHPHFLGAVVLEQLANSTGSIESRQVIDGQQRFTTLQLFLIAARDHAMKHGIQKYIERFTDLVGNRRSKIDHDHEVFKVWPTNGDRAAYRAVHEARSLAALDKTVKSNLQLKEGTHNIIDAYRYFYDQLGDWIAGKQDDADEAGVLMVKMPDDRLESLWQVVKGQLQVVVIDLDKDDETQVIFETLNARGEDLLPADLIKNYLFRRCAANEDDVEALYERHWRPFDASFWRQEITQGRLKRPRIDIYIQHYLTLMTREEIKTSHLFNAFKDFEKQRAAPDGTKIPYPTTPADHVVQLSRYAEVFRTFQEPGKNVRLATFLRRLEAVDTSTVYPFLLHACSELLPENASELNGILDVLESFLIRRMICGLTPKGYNRLFVDLVRATERAGGMSVAAVADQLVKATGDSARFPQDDELRRAIFDLPLYGRLAQYKVRAILEALDAKAYSLKSEAQPLPDDLTIEHVMPQSWMENWPIPAVIDADPVEKMKFTGQRHRVVNTLGNLTLITGSLNPSLSNGSWVMKRPELIKFSKLNLNQYFHGTAADVWDEDAISRRTEKLFEDARAVWPPIGRLVVG